MTQTNKILIIVALFWLAQYIYVPNTAPYLLAQKVTADLVGIIVGVYGGVQMSLRFPIGIFADVLGKHKYLIVLGCLCSGSASIVRLLFSNGEGFLVANIMSGISSSLWLSFMLLYTKPIAAEKMQSALGLMFAANNFGILLAFAISTFFYQYFGMDFLCAISVISGLTAFTMALTLKENDPDALINTEVASQDKENTNKNISSDKDELENSKVDVQLDSTHVKKERPSVLDLFKVILKGRIWFFALLATIQQGVTMSTIMSFSNEAALKIGGSSFDTGLMTLVYIGFCVISSYYSGHKILVRIGAATPLIITLLLLGFYCFYSVITTDIYVMIALQAILGISFGFIFSLSNSEALKGVESYRRSSGLGLFQAIFAGGMTVVPIIAGALIQADEGALQRAFYFQGVICIVGAVLTTIYYAVGKFKHLHSAQS